jgi:glycine cleavage system protein P-like pyridoxal-binding family
MKLNAAAEMIPVTWPEFGALHPFVPLDQAQGYAEMFESLSKSLAEVTRFHAVSLQPNAGSQGKTCFGAIYRAFRGVYWIEGDPCVSKGYWTITS